MITKEGISRGKLDLKNLSGGKKKKKKGCC